MDRGMIIRPSRRHNGGWLHPCNLSRTEAVEANSRSQSTHTVRYVRGHVNDLLVPFLLSSDDEANDLRRVHTLHNIADFQWNSARRRVGQPLRLQG
mgnify:CR=1 FL=1